MPSLFNNEYSKGPLYQYWKERGAEEKGLRNQRVEEARIRSKGFTPMDPAFGPSSNDSYKHRRASGPPDYEGDQPTGTQAERSAVGGDDLPTYYDPLTSTGHPSDNEGTLLSAEEEKSRLRRLGEQNRQTESDAAIARTLSEEERVAAEAEGKGKQPERRKSTAGKVGRWLADAATGYTKKQERW